MDHSSLMSLCKGFQYEKYPIGTCIFKKGELSNNKFYVILSGKIAIVVPKKVQIPAQRLKVENQPKPPMPKRELSLKILKSSNKGSTRRLNVNLHRDHRDRDAHSVGREKTEAGSPKRDRTEGGSPKIDRIETGTNCETPTNMITDRNDTPKIHFLKRQKPTWGALSLMQYSKEESQDHKGDHTERQELPSQVLPKDVHVRTITKEEEEGNGSEHLIDEDRFQEYASQFGNIVRFMETGESFGDLALKDDIPRQATVVCNTECELLVITKAQFEIIFLAKEREKEDFLRSMFPFLKTLSTMNFNNILYSFQVSELL